MKIVRPALAVLFLSLAAQAQSVRPSEMGLPSAPAPRLDLSAQAGQGPQMPMPGPAPSPPAQTNFAAGSSLTRMEAEQIALKNNPRVTVSELLALAQHQTVRESRSADLPTLLASVTAEDAINGSRMVPPDDLVSSRLFSHAGAGVELTQLITDFGHTHNLILTQKLNEQSSNAHALATKEEIVLAADQAFYDALTAQAVLRVAQQTVVTRQTTQTQVAEMTKNNLKSTLDLAFANVDLSRAQLLQLDAQNNADASMAVLDDVLGFDHQVNYRLVDDTAPVTAPPADAEQLIQTALGQRPDLQSLTFGQQSAQKYARAEWEQLLPNISALGTTGMVPINVDRYYNSNWFGGVGVNMNIPIFNGFLYTAQARQAEFEAKADAERTRDLRDKIVSDVRTAWLQTTTSYQRIAVTTQLLAEANMSLALAQARYRLGLSSIVELSDAQLQQTSAAIDNVNSFYQYRLSLATLNYQIGTNP